MFFKQPYEIFIELFTDPRFKRYEAVLSYGVKPEPWASIVCGSLEYEIELPQTTNPYKNWYDWFLFFLEQVIRQASEVQGVEIKVLTNKNNTIALYDKNIMYE